MENNETPPVSFSSFVNISRSRDGITDRISKSDKISENDMRFQNFKKPILPDNKESFWEFRGTMWSILNTSFGTALIFVLLTFFFLVVARPPIILTKTEEPIDGSGIGITEDKINWISLFSWSLVVGISVLLINPILKITKPPCSVS